jgi:hypothetical protein
MGVGNKIFRWICLYGSGVVCAFIFAAGTIIFCFASAYLQSIVTIYTPTVFYLAIFLSIPLGGPLGMYFLDKLADKLPMYPIWRIVAGFLMGLAGITFIWLSSQVAFLRDTLAGMIIFNLSPIPFLFPFVIPLFSLIGYQMVGLFENKSQKWESHVPIEEGKNSINGYEGAFIAHHEEKRHVFTSQILPLGILVILVSATFYLIVTWPDPEIEAVKATDFVKQFLASVNEETDFYEKHSKESAIQQIQYHRSLISNDYDIYRNKCTKGWYEYYITFGNKHMFDIGIAASKNVFVVADFTYLGLKGRQPRSAQGISNEEAATFFNQILFSINNRTDFYKKNSTEPAIQEIQTYRPMISNNNVLVYRHWEGEHDYYFYIEFDGKHGFEVYVEASNNGCLVKSFTYLEERGKWKIRWLEGVSH